MTAQHHNPLYVLIAAALWLLLVYRDARRMGMLTELYRRTRHPLVAASILGTLSGAVGMTLLVVGVYLMATGGPTPAISPPAARTIAVGGLILILGWVARLAAWLQWKRIAAAPPSPPAPEPPAPRGRKRRS
jgi:hypothetical protein